MRNTLLLLLGALLLSVPAAAKGGDCSCQGISEVTLAYTGTLIDARVTVEATVRGGKNQTVFDDVVQPGGTFTVTGPGETLGPTIRIRVNRKMNATFRTNCSVDLVPGYSRRDFEVVEALDQDGEGVCSTDDGEDDDEGDDDDDGEEDDDGEDDDDGEEDDDGEDDDEGEDGDDGEEPDCAECEGQVTELTLAYHGEEEAHVIVTQKVGRDHRYRVFSDFVEPEGLITITGANRKGTFGPNIRLVVDGNYQGKLDTSCEDEIGQGTVVGDFEVAEGYSRVGGRLCAAEGGDGEPECEECEGQVSSLSLRYLGDELAHVEVQQKDRGSWVTIYDELVDPDGAFTVFGASRKDTLGPAIRIFVEGDRNASFHTSCSEDIGPGLVEGDFEVIDGFSRNGGRLCTMPSDE